MATPPHPSNEQRPTIVSNLLLALRLAWNLGFIIAIPAVLFGFGGAYLDQHLGTSPWVLLTGLAIAMLLSGIGVYRKLKEILPL